MWQKDNNIRSLQQLQTTLAIQGGLQRLYSANDVAVQLLLLLSSAFTSRMSSVAAALAECNRCSPPPSSLDCVQLLTICDIVGVCHKGTCELLLFSNWWHMAHDCVTSA